jgi:hypothetical protein
LLGADETNTEGHVLDVGIGNQIISGDRQWGKLEELQQGHASESPSLQSIGSTKLLRVGEGLGEGDDGSLAVQGPGKLLGFGQNDVEVNLLEESRKELALMRFEKGGYAPCLNLVCDIDEEVGAVALIVMCRDKVEETDKAHGEVLSLGTLQALKNDLHDHNEVVLEGRSGQMLVGSRLGGCKGTYGGKFATTVSNRSNPKLSLALVETSFWKIPRMGSI